MFKKKINKNWGTQPTRNDSGDGTQFIHYEVHNGVWKANFWFLKWQKSSMNMEVRSKSLGMHYQPR